MVYIYLDDRREIMISGATNYKWSDDEDDCFLEFLNDEGKLVGVVDTEEVVIEHFEFVEI